MKTQLAVLDNGGSNNTQATTKDGERRCKQIFSKVMQNWVVEKISETKDWEYISRVMFPLEASLTQEVPRIGLIPPKCCSSQKNRKRKGHRALHPTLLKSIFVTL